MRNLSRRAWRRQRAHARGRGIGFWFTYEEWHSWWETELAKIGPDAKRGCRRGEYGMCRFNDLGPYAPGNVYCGQPIQNRTDYCRSVYSNPAARYPGRYGFSE